MQYLILSVSQANVCTYEINETAQHTFSNHMLIHRYCRYTGEVKLYSLCGISLQREGKWLFLEGSRCWNLILWMECLTFNCTIVLQKKKKSSHMFILCLKGTLQFQYACKQRQGSISNSSVRRKNIKVDCYEIKTLCLIFLGERELCVWLPLLPLVSTREIKNSKRKTRRDFF